MMGIYETKRYPTFVLKMKDLDEVNTILGIKIKKHSNSFVLNQSIYIEKLIDKFSHLNIYIYIYIYIKMLLPMTQV